MALKNRFIKSIINTPAILNLGQSFLGANAYKLGLYQSMLSDKRGKLLDFGCSYGNTTSAFLDFEYYGVDIDEGAIEAAKKRFSKYPNVHFECIDVLSNGYKLSFFDHILFASTSHHLSDEEFSIILDKLLACLKPGGELHYFDIFQKPDDKWSTKLLTRFDQGKFIRIREQSEAFFKKYPHREVAIFPSPDKFIKLWDFMYVKITR